MPQSYSLLLCHSGLKGHTKNDQKDQVRTVPLSHGGHCTPGHWERGIEWWYLGELNPGTSVLGCCRGRCPPALACHHSSVLMVCRGSRRVEPLLDRLAGPWNSLFTPSFAALSRPLPKFSLSSKALCPGGRGWGSDCRAPRSVILTLDTQFCLAGEAGRERCFPLRSSRLPQA